MSELLGDRVQDPPPTIGVLYEVLRERRGPRVCLWEVGGGLGGLRRVLQRSVGFSEVVLVLRTSPSSQECLREIIQAPELSSTDILLFMKELDPLFIKELFLLQYKSLFSQAPGPAPPSPKESPEGAGSREAQRALMIFEDVKQLRDYLTTPKLSSLVNQYRYEFIA